MKVTAYCAPRQWQQGWLFQQGVHAPLVPGCPAGTERLYELEFIAALMRLQVGHQSWRCALFIHKPLAFKEIAKTLNRKEVVADSLSKCCWTPSPSDGTAEPPRLPREGLFGERARSWRFPVRCLPAVFLTLLQLIEPLEIQKNDIDGMGIS